MENFLSETSIELLIILASMMLLIVILFIINIVNSSKIKKLKIKYNRFMGGISDRNIEQLLEDCIDNVRKVDTKNKEIEVHMNKIERNVLQCVQKFAIVRFNAFENMGSDLSFAIAMMDSNDNGIVISGIYARDSSSTYAKPLVAGKSKYILSSEEMQAVEIAKKSNRERIYID